MTALLVPSRVLSACRCPRCGDTVLRVPRRSVDVFFSHFIRVYRYRCGSPFCGWEGNFRFSLKNCPDPMRLGPLP